MTTVHRKAYTRSDGVHVSATTYERNSEPKTKPKYGWPVDNNPESFNNRMAWDVAEFNAKSTNEATRIKANGELARMQERWPKYNPPTWKDKSFCDMNSREFNAYTIEAGRQSAETCEAIDDVKVSFRELWRDRHNADKYTNMRMSLRTLWRVWRGLT